MQASHEQLAEDHDQSSHVAIMAQEFPHSARLNKDLGTQKASFGSQESFDDAPQTFQHPVSLNEDLGSHKTSFEDQESFHDAEEEEEFSFTFDGDITSPIAAEDAFHNGKIRPMFPLFDQNLLLEERYFEENMTVNPNVKKVLVEMNKHSLEPDDISGPYCEWNNKDTPKKSNSTGFSKLWRLRELVTRSNSDGRDTFVFLNNRSSSNQNASSLRRKDDIKAAEEAVSGDGEEESKDKEKVKKGGKKKTPPVSSHEVYLKNKAKENDGRKKSYMPYKQEVVGFFTNANGGISKNVHPY